MKTRTRSAKSKAAPALILASSSPRRRALLRKNGYSFNVVKPAGVREIAPDYLSPGETVLANARAKARAVAAHHPGQLVLGVDTEVYFEGRVLGKPADLPSALAMLRRLNGRKHEVYSGVWITSARGERGFVEISQVRFHRRTLAELQHYLARIKPLDKAGAYAAQEDRGEMIAGVAGSYSNVIGLPMERLELELQNYFSPALALPSQR